MRSCSRRLARAASLQVHALLNPLVGLGVCSTGGALAMLTMGAGEGGPTCRSDSAQRVLCTSVALTWFALAGSKLVHEGRNVAVHVLKAVLQFVGAGAALLPVSLGLSDICTLRWVAAVNVGTVAVITLVTWVATSTWSERHLGAELSQSVRGRKESVALVLR